jgi:hypothetical protein
MPSATNRAREYFDKFEMSSKYASSEVLKERKSAMDDALAPKHESSGGESPASGGGGGGEGAEDQSEDADYSRDGRDSPPGVFDPGQHWLRLGSSPSNGTVFDVVDTLPDVNLGADYSGEPVISLEESEKVMRSIINDNKILAELLDKVVSTIDTSSYLRPISLSDRRSIVDTARLIAERLPHTFVQLSDLATAVSVSDAPEPLRKQFINSFSETVTFSIRSLQLLNAIELAFDGLLEEENKIRGQLQILLRCIEDTDALDVELRRVLRDLGIFPPDKQSLFRKTKLSTDEISKNETQIAGRLRFFGTNGNHSQSIVEEGAPSSFSQRKPRKEKTHGPAEAKFNIFDLMPEFERNLHLDSGNFFLWSDPFYFVFLTCVFRSFIIL